MSKIISGLSDWQAPRLKKRTIMGSQVGPNAWQKDRERSVDILGDYYNAAWWDVVNGAVTFGTNNFSVNYTGAYAEFVRKNDVVQIGKYYRWTYRIVTLTRGTIDFFVGGGGVTNQAGSVGTYSGVKLTESDGRLQFSNSDFEGTIDSIKIEFLPYWRP